MPSSNHAAQDVAAIADSCLSFLAENPEELLAFMQHAGLDPQSLRGALGTTQLQHGLIDYFASNEPILLALTANSSLTPEHFMGAWHRLNRED